MLELSGETDIYFHLVKATASLQTGKTDAATWASRTTESTAKHKTSKDKAGHEYKQEQGRLGERSRPTAG